MPLSSSALPAYAKLNLTLAVLGKRPDGYHDLASIFQTISLHDTLRIEPSHDGTLTCAVNVSALQSPDNLVLQAADVLRREIGDSTLGARIDLRKSIPVQGGLGGGSSDAAVVLLALNQLWGASFSAPRLETIGARLGSDVPFFVGGGTARISGRGQVVQPLPDIEPLWFVLAKPPVAISTADIFRRLAPRDYSSAHATEVVERALLRHEPLPMDHLANSLEDVVLAAYPEVQATRDALRASGAPLVRMSGSGPTLYVPFRSRADAAQVWRRAQARELNVWLCRAISRDEYRASILGSL